MGGRHWLLARRLCARTVLKRLAGPNAFDTAPQFSTSSMAFRFVDRARRESAEGRPAGNILFTWGEEAELWVEYTHG
jgi:hypothetical protein